MRSKFASNSEVENYPVFWLFASRNLIFGDFHLELKQIVMIFWALLTLSSILLEESYPDKLAFIAPIHGDSIAFQFTTSYLLWRAFRRRCLAAQTNEKTLAETNQSNSFEDCRGKKAQSMSISSLRTFGLYPSQQSRPNKPD